VFVGLFFFFFQAEDGIRDVAVTGVQTCALPILEIGLATLGRGEEGEGRGELESWLAALYAAPAPKRELFESYVHDAPIEPLPSPLSRSRLSWWALLFMTPALPVDPAPWSPASVLLESQGLAVLRRGDRYVSVECGQWGGGQGHPDRLHLTLHADGVHWLPDPGTGAYVVRDLFWYRSTLAHNAPRLDGVSQPAGDATCEMFDDGGGGGGGGGEWAWTRGRYGDVTRTVGSGRAYLLDVVELA